MSEQLLIQKQTLVNIANAIRSKTGSTADIEVNDLAFNITENIVTNVELPELTTPGSSTDLLAGKQLIDQDGNIVTGTIQSKTVLDLTAENNYVIVPAGYYASQASKYIDPAIPAPTLVQVMPNGQIVIKSSYSTGGYVDASVVKTTTQMLPIQEGKTVTPTTENQVAVSTGLFSTGDIIVVGDPNLIASNIKSGVTIFGITGTYTGANTITFYIEDTPYQTEENMTWEQWVNSSYNTASAIVDAEGYIQIGSNWVWEDAKSGTGASTALANGEFKTEVIDKEFYVLDNIPYIFPF